MSAFGNETPLCESEAEFFCVMVFGINLIFVVLTNYQQC